MRSANSGQIPLVRLMMGERQTALSGANPGLYWRINLIIAVSKILRGLVLY